MTHHKKLFLNQIATKGGSLSQTPAQTRGLSKNKIKTK